MFILILSVFLDVVLCVCVCARARVRVCMCVDCFDRFLCKADEQKKKKNKKNKQRAVPFFACFIKYVLCCRETTKPRWEPDASFQSERHNRKKNLATVMKVGIIKDASVIRQMSPVWK